MHGCCSFRVHWTAGSVMKKFQNTISCFKPSQFHLASNLGMQEDAYAKHAVFTMNFDKLYSLGYLDLILPCKQKSIIKFKVRKVVWCIQSEFRLAGHSCPSQEYIANPPNSGHCYTRKSATIRIPTLKKKFLLVKQTYTSITPI